MATYYVGATSAGLNNGTSPENCWNVTTFNSQHASVILPGDTIYILDTHNAGSGGTHYITLAKSGTLNSRITIRGDYPGRPGILDGNNLRVSALYTNGFSHLTISNLEVKNFTQRGFFIQDASGTQTVDLYVTVDKCNLYNIGNTYTSATSIRAYGRYFTLSNCIIDGCGDDCVSIRGKYAKIYGNVIKNPSLSGATGDCIALGGSSAELDGYEIYNNILDHTNIDSKHCIVISNLIDSAVGRIYNNTILCYLAGIVNIGIFVEDGSCTIYGNNFTNGVKSVSISNLTSGKHLVFGNISTGATSYGLTTNYSASAPTNVIFANNTVTNTSIGIAGDTNNNNIQIINNIITNCTKGIWRFLSGQSESYNCIYNCTNLSMSGAGAATVETLHITDITTNPLLGTNYVPASNSPAIATGTKYWNTGPRPSDLNGKPLPDYFIDIGAVQSTYNTFHPANIG